MVRLIEATLRVLILLGRHFSLGGLVSALAPRLVPVRVRAHYDDHFRENRTPRP